MKLQVISASFWDRVIHCEHEWTEHVAGGDCDTPYCQWHEKHCKKCKVFQMTCDCGYMNGMSGWSELRNKRQARRKAYRKLLARVDE